MKMTFFGIIYLFAVSALSSTSSESYFRDFLRRFRQNPQAVMNTLPDKFDSRGNLVKSHRFVSIDEKNRYRDRLVPALDMMARMTGENDVRQFFIRERVETNLEKLSSTLVGEVKEKPWSGDYWPTYRAGIASRYRDQGYPRRNDFREHLNYFDKSWDIDLHNEEVIDQLSPAEKYDLLMGLSERPLARSIIDEAENTYRSNNNKIETWFGICHGWAPASFMMKRPKNVVEVESVLPNLKIKFYPDDIKALASHLWANTTLLNRVIGGRCDDKKPKKDDNGRILAENCYDVNPAAWHLAVVNQVGLKEDSFVFDATYDHEVWNQPIVSYQVKFFNPVTDQDTSSFSEAMVDLGDYKKDIFKKYRSPQARFIVGVYMEVTYVAEVDADGKMTDDLSNDSHTTVHYVYDLEIDSRGQIIGGEWYQNAHPDFIWAPARHARAVSVVERELEGEWQGSGSPPASWVLKAEFAARYSQPLASVVENLIRLAQ